VQLRARLGCSISATLLKNFSAGFEKTAARRIG